MPAPSRTARHRRLGLAAVVLHMAGIGLTLGVLFPLTSLTLERWGVADRTIGLAGSMSPVAILLLMPFLPRIAARLGAVRSMLAGCALAAAAFAAMHAFQSVPAWLAGRFLIGAGLALPWLVGDVWINTVSTEAVRGRVIGAYVACFFAGFASGPLALDAVGLEGFRPHALGIGALALATLPLAAARRLAPPIEASSTRGLLGSMRAVPTVAVGAVAAGFAESAAFALLPVWGLGEGLSESGALALLSTFIVGGIALQLGVGVLADRTGRASLLAGAGLGLAAAAVALELAGPGAAFALAFVAGGLALAIYGLSLTLLGQRFAPAELATASAAWLVLYQLGSVSGPFLAGAAMDLAGGAGFVAALAVAGLACAAAAILGRGAREVSGPADTSADATAGPATISSRR